MSPSDEPPVRRCPDPIVPSSKVKYEDGYLATTSAPLTMMYLGEAEQGRSGLLGNYTGAPLPSILPVYPRSTPSLASSILTSASTSPRSVSSSLYGRFNDQVPLTNSPSTKLRDPYYSPYGNMNYLSKPANQFDYRDSDRHADWTPPQGRNTLQLPAFGQYYDTPDGSPSDFSYSSSSEHFDSGLVPVHPHFARS